MAQRRNIQGQNNRGVIGIRENKRWRSVYNFKDSSPTIFGHTIWKMLQNNWKSLDKWGKELLKYGYWEEFLNEGYCPYCGKFDVGLPTQISTSLFVKLQDGQLAPDLEAKFHSHKPKTGPVESKNEVVDGLWVEWSYIVNPKDYMLEIFRSVRDKGTYNVKQNNREWRQSKYRYHSIGLFSLFNDEPDWTRIERIGLAASAYYWEKFSSQSNKKIIL